jgi:hypothetical protein
MTLRKKRKTNSHDSYIFFNEISDKAEKSPSSLNDPGELKRVLRNLSRTFKKTATQTGKLMQRLSRKKTFPMACVGALRKIDTNLSKILNLLDPLSTSAATTPFKKVIEKATGEVQEGVDTLRGLLKKAPTKNIFGTPLPSARKKLATNVVIEELSHLEEASIRFYKRFKKLSTRTFAAPEAQPPTKQKNHSSLTGIPASSKFLKEFMETAKDKGWITDTDSLPVVVDEEIKEADIELPISEGFQTSSTVLKQLEVGKDTLLPAAVPFGLVKVPIVIVQNGRSSDTFLLKLSKMDLGYKVHKVYDNYVAIDNMVLMGLHKQMVLVYDTGPVNNPKAFWKALRKPKSLFSKKPKKEAEDFKKLKIKLDTSKFITLAPFLGSEYPDYADLLQKAGPVNPAIRVGNHYYCPLLPYSLGDARKLRINSWSPLFKTN